ncbi:hypothetical protein TKK_0004167 [Trichogramma kaykai]|uniref:Centrosomal protein of 78 kDa n=1 Tax=Trichogramma kaykai TaxID=54128 RepID=A0ABD2XKT6_9HYME
MTNGKGNGNHVGGDGGGVKNSFASCYMELCRQQRVRPLPMICVTLPHALDFSTDRVKMDDWTPILNSLSLDCTLRTISVHSKYQHRKILDSASTESKARAVGKAPLIVTRYVVEWLMHSTAQCVRNSQVLTSLELEGISIPADCLAVLCVGLASTKSLRTLSLERCHIGDAGCELLCRCLAEVHSLRTLNLAHCELTSASGPHLASALCKQKLALYHDAWMQSLRYREPKLDSMPGLRRLTLNGNTKLGNEAVTAMIEAIRDSLWFKALDLQQCGLSESLSHDIFELLEHNRCLVVVDCRLNPGWHEETLNEIARRVGRNEAQAGAKGANEFRWLPLPQQKNAGPQINPSKRVLSAGNLRMTRDAGGPGGAAAAAAAAAAGSASKPNLTRPRSAMLRQAKRPPPPIVYRKPLLAPVPQMLSRLRTRPAVPMLDRRPRQPVRPLDRQLVPVKSAEPTKMSLHLDLQSQIQTVSSQSARDNDQNSNNMQLVPLKSCSIAVQTCSSSEEDESTTSSPRLASSSKSPSQGSQRIQEVIRRLLETEEQRDQLQEDSRRDRLALAEERARREFAESKLRAAKCSVAELEEELRQRELQSRGYLLISQKSMEEICASFTKLLDMLGDATTAAATASAKSSENSIARLDQIALPGVELEDEDVASLQDVREDIKRHFAFIIRKTKSENLKRGCFIRDDNFDDLDDDLDDDNNDVDMTARYGRSEGNINIGAAIEPVNAPLLRIERPTGDNADVVSARLAHSFHTQNCADQTAADAAAGDVGAVGDGVNHNAGERKVPSDRARTLFASIINGDALLRFNESVR